MLGDYHLAGQPYWGVDFTDLDKAIVAADLTWDWCVGTYGTSWDGEANARLVEVPTLNSHPWSQEAADEHATPENMVVFVYEPKTDELVEQPNYVRGNPRCTEEEVSGRKDLNRSQLSNAPQSKRRRRTRGVRKRTRRR